MKPPDILFYWHFLEILWLFIFLVFYNSFYLMLDILEIFRFMKLLTCVSNPGLFFSSTAVFTFLRLRLTVPGLFFSFQCLALWRLDVGLWNLLFGILLMVIIWFHNHTDWSGLYVRSWGPPLVLSLLSAVITGGPSSWPLSFQEAIDKKSPWKIECFLED